MSSKEYYDKYLRKYDNEDVCKTCGKRTNFISFTRGYAEHCSKACTQKDINAIKLRENTNIEKYGASNVFASDEIKERIKKNNLIKYGVEYTTTLKSTKDKQKAIKLQRYGSETYNNAQKAKETCLERYGVSCGVQTLKAKQRAKESYKDYHFNKSMMCLNNSIRLIHFYETLDSKLFIKDFINRIFTNTEEISNDFNKYSPLQFPHYSEVTYSGPKRLNYTEYDVYDSGSFTIIK